MALVPVQAARLRRDRKLGLSIKSENRIYADIKATDL
jgi:hypothetical protein